MEGYGYEKQYSTKHRIIRSGRKEREKKEETSSVKRHVVVHNKHPPPPNHQHFSSSIILLLDLQPPLPNTSTNLISGQDRR